MGRDTVNVILVALFVVAAATVLGQWMGWWQWPWRWLWMMLNRGHAM